MRLRRTWRAEDDTAAITPCLLPSAPSAHDILGPEITDDVLDHLSKHFPDRLPNDLLDAQSIALLIGQQTVIRHLRALNNSQKDPKD